MSNELAKFLARLTALKNNLPETRLSEKRYVDEYHLILDGLELEAGEKLNDFRISHTEIQPKIISYSPSRGTTYSREIYCDRQFLLMKVDSLLGYFTLLLQPEEVKNKLGFDIEEQAS